MHMLSDFNFFKEQVYLIEIFRLHESMQSRKE